MNRRHFLTFSATLALSPSLLLAGEPIAYVPGQAEADMDAGKVLLLDFWASWCVTCAAQSRAMDALKAASPAYEQAITFYRIDWDVYGKGDLSKTLKIPRRSTLVALKGRTALGRLVAATRSDDIKSLLDTALSAATA